MVVRDELVYNHKQAVWAQMPNKTHFTVLPVAEGLLPEQSDFLASFSGIVLHEDGIEQSALPTGVELSKSESGISLKVTAAVQQLDILYVNTSIATKIEFANGVDCLVTSHVFTGNKAHSIDNNWQLLQGAKVKHCLHVYGGAAPINVYHVIKQDSETDFKAWRVVHSGAWLHEHTHCQLTGIKAMADIKSLVLSLANNNCQSGARFEHIAPETSSKHLVNMLVAENARGVCFSDVEVMPNASGVYSEQYNKNLALATSAEIFTQPRLCINNDDVVCSHGATTGELEVDKINYLCARGLSVTQAKQLLVQAYANAIFLDSPNTNWSALALEKLRGL